ncbi:MAG: transcription elongation factor GreA [Anaerolineaceae bacterium]|nr:transcription elongation factor GreA [Anaerolineaceae bacterium]
MNNTFLTKEGFEKLQQELDYLQKDRRKEIAIRLREASDGEELIENAEYEAAKNEQAFVEGRIKELKFLLATAKIIEKGGKGDTIQIGSKVTIQEEGLDEKESLIIVGATEANPIKKMISNYSPLGRALIGHKKNDVVTVQAPDGEYKVKIIRVS